MLTRMLQCCSHCNRHAAAIALRNRSLRPVVTGGEAARQQSTFATTSNDDCSPSTIRVAFFGTDDFAVPTLVALSKLQGIAGDGSLIRTEVEVFCPADRGKRRGKTVTQPVRKFAEEAGLPISNFPCPERGWSVWQELGTGNNQFDVGVAVSFGHLIPSEVLESFAMGTMNLHPSLLPRYRGAAPIQHTVLNGDASTACSVIELSTGKFDHGQILHQVPITVGAEEDMHALRSRLALTGAEAVVYALQRFETLRSTATSQADTGYASSAAPKLKKTIADVDWNKLTKKEIYRIYRAVGNQFPLRVEWKGKPLALTSLAPESTATPDFQSSDAVPGDVVYHPPSKLLYAQSRDGEWVGVSHLGFPTKKVLNAAGFANGYGVRKHGGKFDPVTA